MGFKNNQVPSFASNVCSSYQSIGPSQIDQLSFFNTQDVSCFVLRDDLMGGRLNGSKHRKYQGLFQELQENHIQKVVIYGSLLSNHFVLAIQYALQFSMKIVAFTQKPFRPLNPNATLALELLHHQHLIYVEHDLKEAAYKWTLEHPDAYLVPLGGFSKSAATSSLSLGNEIAHFHQKQQIDHIILDAGTGLQAAACLIALQEAGFSGQAHVILMGDLDFLNVLHTVASWLDKNIPQFKIMISRPILGKKYGSYHPRLKEFQTLFFQKTGIILDLIYNVKSFHYLYEMIVNKKISGKILIVHSGGTYSATISE